MRELLLNVFHTSDLHFGEKSIAKDFHFPGQFEDYFSFLKDTIYDILQKSSIDILIISGDITSRGESKQYHNQYLLEFLKWFNKHNIPICITNGNHDLVLESIANNNQFQDFMHFIKDNQSLLKCEISNNFTNNQISYVYLEGYNSIFLSLNSCGYIKKRTLFDKIKDSKFEEISTKIRDKIIKKISSTESNENLIGIINELEQEYSISLKEILENQLDNEYLDVGVLKRTHLKEILEELSTHIGINRFKYLNKFVICHHPLEFLRKSKLNYDYLIKNNIHILFSGHFHDFDFQEDRQNRIINLGTGSILANMQSRKELLNFRENPPQFNIYDINLSKNFLQPTQFFFNLDEKWENKKMEKIYDLDLKFGTTLKNWAKVNKINENITRNLQERGLKVVFYKKQTSGPNLIFFNDNDQYIKAFFLKNDDTQLKVELMKKWFLENLNYIDKFMDDMIIIKNTEKFKNQLPIEYIIY